jgi:hypothetical protein
MAALAALLKNLRHILGEGGGIGGMLSNRQSQWLSDRLGHPLSHRLGSPLSI